jgi:hypothetical protein
MYALLPAIQSNLGLYALNSVGYTVEVDSTILRRTHPYYFAFKGLIIMDH